MENATPSTAESSQPGKSVPDTITISPSQRLEQLPVAALLAFVPRLRTTYHVLGKNPHLKVATSRTHYRLKLGTGAILYVSDNIVDLVRLIDGRRSIQALSDALAEQQGRPVHPAEIVYLIRHRLAPGGLVELSFPLALPAPKQANPAGLPARSMIRPPGADPALEAQTISASDVALPTQRRTISRPLVPSDDLQWIPPGRRAERLRATRPLPTLRQRRHRRSSYLNLVATFLIVLAAGAVFAFAHTGFSHAGFTFPSLASFFGDLTPPALNNKPQHMITPTPTPPPLPMQYVVQDDDTLPQIATRFHVTVNALMLVNHLSNPNAIYSGQVLIIPSVYRPGTNPAGYAHPIFYVIQPGDNLYSIAQLFNTTPAALSAYNHLGNPAYIRFGDSLVIP